MLPFAVKQFDIVDAGRLWRRSGFGFGSHPQTVGHWIGKSRWALKQTAEVDVDLSGIERIEAGFDLLASQMSWRFIEAFLQ